MRLSVSCCLLSSPQPSKTDIGSRSYLQKRFSSPTSDDSCCFNAWGAIWTLLCLKLIFETYFCCTLPIRLTFFWLSVTYISLLSTSKVFVAAAAVAAPEQCNLNCFETKFTGAPLVLRGLRAGRWQIAKVWNPPPKKFPYLVSIVESLI